MGAFNIWTFDAGFVRSHSWEGGLIETLWAEIIVLASRVSVHYELESIERTGELCPTHLDASVLRERINLLTCRAIQAVRPEERMRTGDGGGGRCE